MKVTRIDTITCSSYRVMVWVQVHTDEGLIGLGDTCYHEPQVADFIHNTAAPYLLGKDPRKVEQHHRNLRAPLNFGRQNGQVNGLSAIDIALWDLNGQSVGMPIYKLLGGPARDSIRVYNTCHGTTHPFHWQPALEPPDPGDHSARWVRHTPFDEDEIMWKEQGRTGELAQSLLDMGITAMKIWPFDPHRIGTDGQHITQAQIDVALEPFRQVRQAVGAQMDLPVELHGGWYAQAAIRIAEALQEIRPLWIEDPLSSRDNVDGFAEVARKTPIPVAISESLCGRAIFRQILEKQAAGILIMDIGWIGGISEAHFIAQMAQMYDRPFATHDASGPATFVASSHLCIAEPNALILEGIRASYIDGWFHDVLTELPRFERGYISPPNGPGLGASLLPEFLSRPDVAVRTSEL